MLLLMHKYILFINLVICIMITWQINKLIYQIGKSLIFLGNKNTFIQELLDKEE